MGVTRGLILFITLTKTNPQSLPLANNALKVILCY